MDDTTQSRTSDAAAAATRKRRSSILKSQRPPRTPFCDLEFNVCTPTDTAKSRRVSFSRRTGVAEFATNEATNTWKNFYEEHNNSLESSGTDPDANSQRQPIGHLGKRIFDQQFEEVEAVDFVGTLNPGMNINTSGNSFNFTQQLECTGSKLTAPHNRFELSAFTEQQSKLFADDLAGPYSGEITDGIGVNFSAIQTIEGNDDLDEIQKDLQRQSNAVYCHGPFNGGQNLSEYIEVDLNMTHVGLKADVSDMSITDTIHSPKVQELSKSSINKKINAEKDWILDKENIAINPYITPRESVNFAVNEEPDKVLVFDGKKLIVQTEKENYRQTLLPNMLEGSPKRKTIVVDCNDDLPNFIDDMQVSNNASGFVGVSEMRRSVIFDGDMSITQFRLDDPQNTQKNEKQQRTIIYDDELADISVTQAVPNVIATKQEKRRTILYENDTGNITVTQAVPSKITDKEKRNTVLYQNNNSNISITQAVPTKVILTNDNNEKRKTIVYENEACNISMTQVVPTNIIAPDNAATKRRTIVFENDMSNVSITQAIPRTVIKDGKETQRTVVYEDNTGNISVCQSMATSLTQDVALAERRRTVVFESDIGNISVTQAIPSNIILAHNPNATSYKDDLDISMTQAVPTNILLADNVEPNRRRTVLYEDDTGNLSITQAITSNQVIQGLANAQLRNLETCETEVLHGRKANNERKVFIERDDIDLSMTQAVNFNQILHGYTSKQQASVPTNPPEDVTANKRRTIVFEDQDADISVTQAVSVNQVIDAVNEQKQKEMDLIESSYAALHNKDSTGQRTIAFEWEDGDVSVPQAVKRTEQNRSRTIMYDNDENHISMTQAIPTNVILSEPQERRTIVFKDEDSMIKNEGTIVTKANPATQEQKKITIVYQDVDSMLVNEDLVLAKSNTTKEQLERRTIVYEDVIPVMKNEDLSIEVNAVKEQQNRRTIVYEDVNPVMKNEDLSIRVNAVKEQQNRRTIVYEDVNPVMKNEDLFLIEGNPTKEQQKRRTIVYEDVNPVMKNEDLSIGVNAVKEQQNRRTIVYEDVNPVMKNEDLFLIEGNPTKEQQKRRTIVYEDINAIMKNEEFPTEANLVNELQKRRTIVYEDVHPIMKNEDLSLTKGNPTKEQQKRTSIYEDVNPLIKNKDLVFTESYPAKEQQKRITIVYEDADLVLKNEELLLIEANLAREQQKTRTIILEDVDPTLKNKDLLITTNPGKEQRKRTIVFEDEDAMLENKELFMEIDKLIDGSPQKKETEMDVSMAEVNDGDEPKRKTVDNFEMSITQDVFQHVSPNETQNRKHSVVIDETVNTTLSKPIPAELSILQSGIYDKSLNKDTSERFSMLQNLTNVASDILVYHAETASAQGQQKIGADNDDTESQETVAVANAEETLLSAKNSNESDQISNNSMKTKFYKPHDEQSYIQTDVQSQKSIETSVNPKSFVGDTKDSVVEMPDFNTQKSILSDLLDMSNSSMEGIENKMLMTDNVSDHSEVIAPGKLEIECSTNVPETEPLFFITKDSDGESSTNKSEENIEAEPNEREKTKKGDRSQICEKSILPIEFKDKEESAIVGKLKKKFAELKNVLKIDHSPKNNEREPSHSTSVASKESLDKSKNNVLLKSGKPCKMANDTNELLDILSDFTDTQKSMNLVPPLEEDEEVPEPVMIKGHLALENKENTCKPEFRHSLIPKRPSAVLSRDNLRPMAGAALHKSRLELDEFDIEDTGKETPDVPHKKSVRMSTEVVKTLHFDEEDSCNDISIQTEQTDTILTPLKKTAFGEISYMKEGKTRVIPEFLKEVSDGVKELMDDLVKPMADVIPFTAIQPKSIKTSVSTCSNQIQANLLTSSQIDLNSELYSNPESAYDMQKFSSADIITDAVNRSLSRALKSPIESTSMLVQSEKSLPICSQDADFRPAVGAASFDPHIEPAAHKTVCPTKYSERRDPPEQVLIFDHANPLNNVLLMPHVNPMDVHTYDPVQSTDSISVSEKNTYAETLDPEVDNDTVDRVTTQYHIQSKVRPLGNNFDNSETADTRSLISDVSKPLSTEQSMAIVNDLKDIQVNTLIAMKGNKELLEASSSLTLVDDTLDQSVVDIDLDSHTVTSQETNGVTSPVKVLNVEKLPSEKKDSSVTCKEEIKKKPFKSKKRVYSPTKQHKLCSLSMMEVTPKPASKLAKHSYSPVHEKPTKLPAERDESHQETAETRNKTKNRKPGTTVTIQQMMTMVHVESVSLEVDSTPSETREESEDARDFDDVEPQTQTCASEVPDATVELASSFTSSKNLKAASSVTSVSGSQAGSDTSDKMEWAQNISPSEISSKTSTERDSGVDVADLIDIMPFMGSHECEWECSSGETWSFRLLHSRLRLTLRFPRGARVRADTRVLHVALDVIHHDKKNPLGTLCVKFAAAMMQFYMTRGCAPHAGADVPRLVRRAAGAARLAARWARAMHDARARLAYTLTDDGRLALKVANMNLRCVWEVTMQLEMAAEEAAAPWPRASDVCVTRVLAGAGAAPPPSAADVRRALGATPPDWGHAPRTVWKIFKYLKYKKRDGDAILQ